MTRIWLPCTSASDMIVWTIVGGMKEIQTTTWQIVPILSFNSPLTSLRLFAVYRDYWFYYFSITSQHRRVWICFALLLFPLVIGHSYTKWSIETIKNRIPNAIKNVVMMIVNAHVYRKNKQLKWISVLELFSFTCFHFLHVVAENYIYMYIYIQYSITKWKKKRWQSVCNHMIRLNLNLSEHKYTSQ